MPEKVIDATCRYWNGTRWSQGFSGQGKLGGTQAQHAERIAYTEAWKRSGDSKIFHIRQNAFPCTACTAYFLQQSKNKSSRSIIDCTGNHGLYARECGFLATPFVGRTVKETGEMKTEDQIKGALFFEDGKVLAKHKKINVFNEDTNKVRFEGRDKSGGYVGDDDVPADLLELRNQ